MTIAIIAAVTVTVCTLLVCSVLAGRQKTPCLFSNTVAYVGETRIPGGKCTGPADNVFVTWNGALTAQLNGARACDAHVRHMQDLVDATVRESLPTPVRS